MLARRAGGCAKRAVEWKDLAVGGGDNQRIVSKTRVGKAAPPDAAQINADVRSYAANLDDVAAKGKWDEVLPEQLRRFAKQGGKTYVAVPVNVHRQNVMWINAEAMKKLGATAAPKTWDEFFVLADKAKAAGLVKTSGCTSRSCRWPSPR